MWARWENLTARRRLRRATLAKPSYSVRPHGRSRAVLNNFTNGTSPTRGNGAFPRPPFLFDSHHHKAEQAPTKGAYSAFVGREGLEPSSLAALDLKSSVFANFTTCPF